VDAQIDVRFGTDGRPNRPEHNLRDGPISGLAHSCAGLAVFDAKVIVPGARAKPLDLGLRCLSRLQLLQVHEVLAADLREVVEGARRARLERESYSDVRTGGLVVQHEEVVVV